MNDAQVRCVRNTERVQYVNPKPARRVFLHEASNCDSFSSVVMVSSLGIGELGSCVNLLFFTIEAKCAAAGNVSVFQCSDAACSSCSSMPVEQFSFANGQCGQSGENGRLRTRIVYDRCPLAAGGAVSPPGYTDNAPPAPSTSSNGVGAKPLSASRIDALQTQVALLLIVAGVCTLAALAVFVCVCARCCTADVGGSCCGPLDTELDWWARRAQWGALSLFLTYAGFTFASLGELAVLTAVLDAMAAQPVVKDIASAAIVVAVGIAAAVSVLSSVCLYGVVRQRHGCCLSVLTFLFVVSVSLRGDMILSYFC